MELEDRVERALKAAGYADHADLRNAIARELNEVVAAERARARADRVVAMSEEDAVRYRVISQLASNWVYASRVDDGKTVLEWCTEGFQAYTGYSRIEVEERGGYISLIHPDDVDSVFSGQGPLHDGNPTVLEYRIIPRSGDIMWVRDYIRPELDTSGNRVIRIFGAIKDITEEKHAEAALHDALEQLEQRFGIEGARFRALLDQAGDAIFVVSPKSGRIVDVNATACQALGYKRSELMYSNVEEVHPGPVPWRGMESPTLEKGISAETRLVRRSGETFPVEIKVSRKRFIDDDYILVVARETTQRKQMEAQLAQSDRLASVGMLAAGVAHEINNPLVYIINNISYVLEHLPQADKQLSDALREASSGAMRVRDIVSDLKTFARSDGEQIAPIDVCSLVDSVIKVAHNEIRHRAQLVRDYHKVPPVMANARLGQVFLNLLINAAHAIPEGDAARNQIRVAVELRGETVVIEVGDTGVGIDPERLPRIFDPFYTTKPVGTGTGLGLSICANIAKSFNGQITVESTLGRGSAFRVLLPAAPENEAEAKARSHHPGHAPHRTRDILVVDDDVFVARCIRRLLRPHHNVALATSGRDGLQMLKEAAYDLVFCDVMMPEMTGMEFYRSVQEQLPEMAERIVFITGGAFTAEAHALLNEVTNPCIKKPFSPEDLYNVLETSP